MDTNLEKTSEYRIYCAGARQMLLCLLDSDILGAYRGKEPLLEVGVVHSRRKRDYWFNYNLLRALKSDNQILNAFVSGNLTWRYVTCVHNGKDYEDIIFAPKGGNNG